jgi:hypothetical protein
LHPIKNQPKIRQIEEISENMDENNDNSKSKVESRRAT